MLAGFVIVDWSTNPLEKDCRQIAKLRWVSSWSEKKELLLCAVLKVAELKE